MIVFHSESLVDGDGRAEAIVAKDAAVNFHAEAIHAAVEAGARAPAHFFYNFFNNSVQLAVSIASACCKCQRGIFSDPQSPRVAASDEVALIGHDLLRTAEVQAFRFGVSQQQAPRALSFRLG